MTQETITSSPQQYDDSKEDSLWSMATDFYNRKMLPIIILVWVYALVFITLTVFSAVKFFGTEQIKYQIMYAAIFICCIQFVSLIKIFAWQMIHRNGIKRQIKKLELRITELKKALQN
jgi:uncharacterized membrane protein YbjE (DUF340 family)